jgi:hypothetical protein
LGHKSFSPAIANVKNIFPFNKRERDILKKKNVGKRGGIDVGFENRENKLI